MVAIPAFHMDIDEETGEAKPHCHVLLSTRELTESGLKNRKQRDWNRVELLNEWREQYAVYQNAALEAHGFEVRVDHRSYAERGLVEITGQPKRGKAVSQMSARKIATEKQTNFDMVRLKNQFQIVKNPELVFSIVTANHSTFTAQDIAKVLNRYIDSPEQYNILYNRLLGSSELVALETTKDRAVYTTREMLRLEMTLVQTAEKMAAQKTHAVEESVIQSVIDSHNAKLAQHGGLSSDQVAAIRHMLSADQISCVVGVAGAGKTTSLEAAKEAWEQSGYKFWGWRPPAGPRTTLPSAVSAL